MFVAVAVGQVQQADGDAGRAAIGGDIVQADGDKGLGFVAGEGQVQLRGAEDFVASVSGAEVNTSEPPSSSR